MAGADHNPVVDRGSLPVTLGNIQALLHKIVGEIHTLQDYARELDERDVELPFDLYDVEDFLSTAEELSNKADGIE